METSPYGAKFDWREADSDKKGYTLWSPFKESTQYFEPSEKDFMINYHVADIEALVEELKRKASRSLMKLRRMNMAGLFILWIPKEIKLNYLNRQERNRCGIIK